LLPQTPGASWTFSGKAAGRLPALHSNRYLQKWRLLRYVGSELCPGSEGEPCTTVQCLCCTQSKSLQATDLDLAGVQAEVNVWTWVWNSQAAEPGHCPRVTQWFKLFHC